MDERASLSFLHDAELSALSISRKDGIVVVDFITETTCHRLKFSGVIAFRVVDLIQQNVVSQALLSTDNNLTDEYLSRSVEWINSLSDSGDFINADQIKIWIDRIKSGELSLFIVEPSWGAEIAVVFSKLDKTII